MKEKAVFLRPLSGSPLLQPADSAADKEGDDRIPEDRGIPVGQHAVDLQSAAIFFLECVLFGHRNFTVKIERRLVGVRALLAPRRCTRTGRGGKRRK
jgi:hypothetical protein